MDYRFLNTSQKGLLSQKDHKLRIKFAKKAMKKVGSELWVKRLSFYYDGVSFYHKHNPFSDATTEGLLITTKGKKEGNNGRCAKSFVAIAFGKGVVMCEHWDPDIHFNGKHYRDFVTTHWPAALQNSTIPINKLVLQDGDPMQKSRQAMKQLAARSLVFLPEALIKMLSSIHKSMFTCLTQTLQNKMCTFPFLLFPSLQFGDSI